MQNHRPRVPRSALQQCRSCPFSFYLSFYRKTIHPQAVRILPQLVQLPNVPSCLRQVPLQAVDAYAYLCLA
jgi:hypothetical protein